VYARTGVEELWIVAPAARRLMVYRLQENAESPQATYGEAATFISPLFPGLTFHTAEFFRFD
jgi:Uma2 family endonuclease